MRLEKFVFALFTYLVWRSNVHEMFPVSTEAPTDLSMTQKMSL